MPEDMKQMADLSSTEKDRLTQTGLEVEMKNRSGSFFQVDQEIRQTASLEKGIEVLSIREALQKYDWLEDFSWKLVSKDKDQYPRAAAL